MKINTSNYPIFFLDYHEGRLSARQQEEVLRFVEDHPEFRGEFEDFVIEPLQAAEEKFEWKASLRRGEVNQDNLDHYLISSLEGELSAKDETMLQEYLHQHPEKESRRRLIGLTKLVPEAEVFADKKSLKKPVPLMPVYRRALLYAAAAIVLLAMLTGGYYLYLNAIHQPTPQLALPTPQEEKVSPAISTSGDHHESGINEEQNAHRAPTPTRAPSKKQKPFVKEIPAVRMPGLAAGPDSHETQPDLHEEPQPVADVVLNQPSVEEISHSPTTETNTPVTYNTPAKEEYISVWEALRRQAGKEAERLTGQALPANQAPKVTDLIGKSVQKATHDKVKYNSNRDEHGKLTAFNIFAGKFSIEHSTGD